MKTFAFLLSIFSQVKCQLNYWRVRCNIATKKPEVDSHRALVFSFEERTAQGVCVTERI